MSRRIGDRHERVVHFQLKGNVHFIQARKAWEDEDTWTAGVAVSKFDGVVGVVFSAEGEHLPPGRPVWVTERWGVLAYVHEDGNAIAVKDLVDIPRSVFARAGTQRLMFNAVERLEEPAGDLEELVYGTIAGMDGEDRFSIVRRVDAEYGAEIAEVINSCTTWGEVRQMASPRLWTDLLGRTGYGGIEEFTADLNIGNPVPGAESYAADRYVELDHSGLPDDDEPFEPIMIAGFQDGDYPPAIEFLQESLVPSHLADEFGARVETIFNGTFLYLSPESGPPIVEAMEELGHRCVEAPELFYAGFLL